MSQRAGRASETSFAGANGDRVSALLVPAAPPVPHAALLFGHWGFGDRTSFAAEAAHYAAHGATCLLVDAPGFGARPGMRVPAKRASAVRAYAEQFVGDLQRAIDLLCAQPGVDPRRIGYVGHSLGAAIAGAFLAREPRVRVAALLAGTGSLSRLWLNTRDPEGAASLASLDGVVCLPHASAELFLQFAERDEFISREDAQAQLSAAREPKRAAWYDCDHALDAAALQDRARWLGERLGLPLGGQILESASLPRDQLRRYRALKPLLRIARWLGG